MTKLTATIIVIQALCLLCFALFESKLNRKGTIFRLLIIVPMMAGFIPPFLYAMYPTVFGRLEAAAPTVLAVTINYVYLRLTDRTERTERKEGGWHEIQRG